jgi:hypothetical protein
MASPAEPCAFKYDTSLSLRKELNMPSTAVKTSSTTAATSASLCRRHSDATDSSGGRGSAIFTDIGIPMRTPSVHTMTLPAAASCAVEMKRPFEGYAPKVIVAVAIENPSIQHHTPQGTL